ncbi:hypothetical protein LJY25_08990 [Hymenobacter sp. BT175]|uniref:hypothetical protein n=1 Tax=Hymenobacter translucens TaxID=2886507 RepID=UPI001D0E65BA|nr:hypothetical protein [Hymenobacter translucens]MCC2546576.1 hypothetical protein [Hymenobacter translucens]
MRSTLPASLLSTPTARLQLYHVPAGRRLDFDKPAGQYAYLYRRSCSLPWQCIAYNACSPHLDQRPLPPGDQAEYVVAYYDATGQLVGQTPAVKAAPVNLPAGILAA